MPYTPMQGHLTSDTQKASALLNIGTDASILISGVIYGSSVNDQGDHWQIPPYHSGNEAKCYNSQPMADAPSTAAELPSRPLIRNLALPLNIFNTFSS
jgi:hypothetical protein